MGKAHIIGEDGRCDTAGGGEIEGRVGERKLTRPLFSTTVLNEYLL